LLSLTGYPDAMLKLKIIPKTPKTTFELERKPWH
jgi:hypothetical protein